MLRAGALLWLTVGVCAGAAAAGVIEGKVEPAGKVKAVWAVERVPREIFTLENVKHPGTFDPKSGEFSIPNLAPGTYDLAIDLAELSIEGVDLRLRNQKPPLYDLKFGSDDVVTDGLDAQRDLGAAEFASDEERLEAIRAFFRVGSLLKRFDGILKVEQFMDKTRALYVHGSPTQAKLLVMLARFGSFHAEAGDEVIWRVEVWPMRWYYGDWAKERFAVVYRLRLPAAEYRAMGRLFDPKLGGIEVREGEAARRDYVIPEKLDGTMGKMPGAEF